MIEHLTEKAKEVISHNKVELKSKSKNQIILEVDDNSVTIKKRQGATLILCNCCNHPYNSASSALCYHKIAAIDFLMNKFFDDCLKKIYNEHKFAKESKLEINQEVFFEDINKLNKARFASSFMK